ncbi:MAG: glutathione S-transferase family protein [Phenylobacterium sp.]|uniref:glutathione S-transferase family protein n=1 Tax=Phenylobacterium sp. TaxID=1871053 RepID=UPI00301770C6
MRVFGDSISGNCLKVKWTSDHLGLPYDWVETRVLTGETRTPDFLAMNPAGQVPLAVLDDGRPLAQSNAIILHLARGSALIPTDPYLQARMFEWMFWEQYSHEPYVAVARFQVRYRGRDPATLEPELVGRAEAALDRLEAALSGSTWLVGDAFSLADMALLPYTRSAPEAGIDLSRWKSLTAWIRRSEGVLGLASLGIS